MNATLTFEQPAWLIILCLALGVASSLVLYYRNSFIKDPTPTQRNIFRVLAVFRAVVVSAIAILLLSPLIRTSVTETQNPVIVVLQDNSESIKNSFGAEDSTTYTTEVQQLINSLGENFEVKAYGVANGLIDQPEYSYNGQMTNLSAAMGDVYNLYGNQNLGGIVLATDGIYNQGSNPFYGVQRNAQFPVYTVALGDTVPQKDLKIDRAYFNDIVYLEDRFKIEVDLLSQNLPASTQLAIYDVTDPKAQKELDDNTVKFESNGKPVRASFVLDADKPGVRHYRLALSPVDGEFTTANNYKDIFIDVLDSRQKVLILANAPHPDISALREAATSNKNYEVELRYANDALPTSYKEYNLLILHQLPSNQQQVKQVVADAKKAGTAVWYILGSQSNIATFNSLQNCLQVTPSGSSQNEATALKNENFSLFTTSAALSAQLQQMPPLFVPFGQYTSGASANVLLKQKIGSVATDYPLLSFQDALGQKTAVLAGEGLWRWRLYDFRYNGNHDLFNELVTKTIQYLAVKQDKRRFRVKPIKNIFLENESIDFTGELYNESYELINEPDVSVTITDEDDKDFPYIMSKTATAYQLSVGNFAEGTYQFKATTSVGGEVLTSSGQFTISPLDLESNNTVADHQLLYQVSEVSGGRMLYPGQLNALAEELLANENIKPVIYTTYRTEPFINLKWIFALLLLLFSVEWFTRKYLGGY